VNFSVKQLQTLEVKIASPNQNSSKSQVIGRLSLVVFDKNTGLVLSFIVSLGRSFKLVEKGQVQEIDLENGFILLNSRRSLQDIVPHSLADQALQAENHLLNLAAVTEGGSSLGIVSDVNIAWPAAILWQVVVTNDEGERLLAKNQIKQITDTEVVFIEDVVNPKFKWQAKKALSGI